MAKKPTGSSASSLASAKLLLSGIDAAEMRRLKMVALDGVGTQKLCKTFHPVASLKIPYFDFDGQPTSFYRVRYLEALPGFLGQAKKPQRYVQAPGSLNEVYMPPSRDWARVRDDVQEQILITEGELKAACACLANHNCIGLGGVDVWRAGKRGLSLLPQLASINFQKRDVLIVFDSDAAVKPAVTRAMLKLSEALVAVGAMVKVVTLPTLKGHDKTGLDDFLLDAENGGGADAFDALLLDAVPSAEGMALWAMNDEVVYIRDPGMVLVMNDGRKLKPSAYKEHAFANRHFLAVIPTKDGQREEMMPLAPHWLAWPHRFELAGIVYEPGQEPITKDRRWNGWKGWGCEPAAGDVSPWSKLLDYMFKGDKAARTWFEQWCAYPIQHPGTKLYSAVAVYGITQGTGKTLIAYTLMRIYGDNAIEIKDSNLEGDFNAWAENRQFVYGDEVTGNDTQRRKADRLKGMITQEKIYINAKYVPEFSIRDCVNYYFSSNHPDAFFLEDSDRRLFVWETPTEPMPSEFYRKVYDPWMRGPGPAALFNHFLNLDLTGFDPAAHAPMTSAKASMIYDNKSDVGAFCAKLRDDPELALLPLGLQVAKECDLLTNTQLLKAYDWESMTRVTANGIGRELKRANFRQVNDGRPVRLPNGIQRLYCVRNEEKWLRTEVGAMVDHWNAFFAPRVAKFAVKEKEVPDAGKKTKTSKPHKKR